MVTYTPLEDIPEIFSDLKTTFETGKTKPIAYRKQQLAQLAWMVKDNIPRFEAALKEDLGRPQLESNL